MRICGQEFTSEMIERIQSAVELESSISRRSLSRQVCEWMDWRAPNGNLQDMSCRKALLELDRRGLAKLPPPMQEYAFENRSTRSGTELPPLPEVSCSLAELGQIEIFPVRSRHSQASRIWNALMEYHYLGSGPLCGAQIRYLIRSAEHGWLGGVSFSSAAWHLKDRDKWIGWSESARRANLHRVVCNSRFLILPTVQVQNLASSVLSRCVKRLPGDWKERYGYTPVLVETFVDPERFRGTCYRAANWVQAGKTSGRRGSESNEKDIYLYPLQEDWKETLGLEPEIPLGSKPRPDNPVDWAEEEFGRVDLYDSRLRERLLTLARDFYEQPGNLVPQACNGSKARIKGAYRFFDNGRVDMETLIKPHVEATVERIREHRLVLAVQDTTILNYPAHPATEDLGPINTKKDKARGLILHDTLAFTEKGTPLGILDVQCWARDEKAAGKRGQRKQLPVEQKESLKWLKSYRRLGEIQRLCPGTTLVSVGDREADIFELFYEATKNPSGPQLLIRAEKTRSRKVEQGRLWEEMAQEPIAGFQEFHISQKANRPGRVAKLAIRFAPVTLQPPKGKGFKPIQIWVVYACEVDYSSEVKSPVEWMLLTTVGVRTFAEAVERLRWYAQRWGIEVYHRTLKSGCRIEDRRLNNADRLEACLAIDMVVAWRILYLTKLGRETPDVPCTVFFKEEEWKALYVYLKREEPPNEPPSLREAMRMTASLGGFIGRRRDGEPGTTTLWRGLQRLEDLAEMYLILITKMIRGP